MYILHCVCRGAGDTEDDEMANGEFQIITECWIEPQLGTVVNSTPERGHLEGMDYMQLAKGVSMRDVLGGGGGL